MWKCRVKMGKQSVVNFNTVDRQLEKTTSSVYTISKLCQNEPTNLTHATALAHTAFVLASHQKLVAQYSNAAASKVVQNLPSRLK